VELPPPGTFIAGLVIGVVAAMLVFRHADREGNRRATAWGIFAFFLPAIALFYFGRAWMRGSRRRR
jgi:hypothetical protein